MDVQQFIHPGTRRADLPGYRKGALSRPALGTIAHACRGTLRAGNRRRPRETWRENTARLNNRRSHPFRAAIVAKIEAARKPVKVIR